MKVDLNKLKALAQEEEEQNNNKNSNDTGYKVVYPAKNGKLTVKLLFNLKSQTVQRKIMRHDAGKTKVVCLEQYGEECPACNAIREVETNRGRESGVFRKYGWKTRGICFAQIIDHEATYFTEDSDPKNGDVVILMYPKTVYDMINKIIIDSIDQGVNLVSENEGIPIVIERTQKGSSIPTYNAYLFPYGQRKSFNDTSEKTGDQLFDELLENLPDLSETMIPKYPTEEVRKQNEALAETISQEYEIGTGVINPGDKLPDNILDEEDDNKTSNLGEIANNTSEPYVSDDDLPFDNNEQSNSNEEQMPECFGNHKNGERKCILCPHEESCFLA